MKTLLRICVLVPAAIASAQNQNTLTTTAPADNSAPLDYAVVERGAAHKIYQRIEWEPGLDGQQIPHLHSYTELRSGMHRLVNGQWVDAQPVITITDNGAVGTGGAHTASFPPDIASGDPVVLTGPDNVPLRTRVMGLAYYDYRSGNHVLIAELTNSLGQLVNGQALYTNAFNGLNSDIRFSYNFGFEQDVILRERPPLPEEFGLDPNSTRLEVWTEFFDPPQPARSQRVRKRWLQATEDQMLDFGAMKIGYGRAFGPDGEPGSHTGFTMAKNWVVTEDGRTFLVEDVSFRWITPHLRPLPPRQAALRKENPDGPLYAVSTNRLLPRLKVAAAAVGSKFMLATHVPERPGLTLDWSAVTSSTNMVFQNDTTYYVSGTVNLSGSGNVLEGGTVIKMATNAELNVLGSLQSKTQPARPAVLTAKDDQSVGESISGSAGSPSGYYAATALSLQNGGDLKYLRILYANEAVYSPQDYTVRHSQFVHCRRGLVTENANFTALNILMNDVTTNFWGRFYQGTAQHLTSHLASSLTDDWEFSYYPGPDCGSEVPSSTVTLVNSLTVCITNGYGVVPVYTDHVVDLGSDTGVFTVAGAGSHYLNADYSPYRDAGTTSIDAGLLSDIQTMTTFPPIVLADVTITNDTTFTPQAQRDTDLLDLGWHYFPLDYLFGGVTANANLTFTPGTAVGWWRTSEGWSYAGHGIHIGDAMTVSFNGTATQPDYWVRRSTVQEGIAGLWEGSYGPGGITGWTWPDFSQAPLVSMRFTFCSILAWDATHMRDDHGYLIVHARDCEFWGGGLGGYCSQLNYTNALFDRVTFWTAWDGAPTTNCSFILQNCLFRGGILNPNRTGADSHGNYPQWVIHDTACDGMAYTYSDVASGNSNWTHFDYNAYITASNTTSPSGTHDLTVSSFNWQASWLGNYYLPTNSTLIDSGSLTNAALIGFYHFTTQTNQAKELNTPLDRSYHYVAVDSNGLPISTGADGVGDYLKDSNGNGIVDSGETDWTAYHSANGLTAAAALQVFTPLK